jgi:hypothetical protein
MQMKPDDNHLYSRRCGVDLTPMRTEARAPTTRTPPFGHHILRAPILQFYRPPPSQSTLGNRTQVSTWRITGSRIRREGRIVITS